jgi:hypothetical protein
MSRNLILGLGAALGLLYLLSSNKGEWYYLNDDNQWIRFSVPMNENIIEASYQSGDETVIYNYPVNSNTRYKVFFNAKLRENDNHSMWNLDMQTGALSKLKRL